MTVLLSSYSYTDTLFRENTPLVFQMIKQAIVSKKNVAIKCRENRSCVQKVSSFRIVIIVLYYVSGCSSVT